jgi:RNA polymerase sigma-70 factor (ECF subfamily)
LNANACRAASDADLVRDVARGDQAAFDELYRRQNRRVLAYIGRFLPDRTLAEEAFADTMLSVWFGAGSFHGGSQVSTWILGIARHKALDAARSLKARKRALQRIAALEIREPAVSPPESLGTSQCQRTTMHALAKLSDAQRQLLHLAYYEDLPYERIGARLKIPVNTVKTRVHHAKRHLARILRPESSLTIAGDTDGRPERACADPAFALDGL